MKKFIISSEFYVGLRLDKWLKKNFSSLTQNFLEKNLRKGNIKVNNLKKPSKYKLKINDEIIIYNFLSSTYSHQEKITSKVNIPLNYKNIFETSIIYQNEDFIILDKWTGISTQGGSKIKISIDHIIKNISNNYNLVHRLDRETSGLLIIAKNHISTKLFGKMFREHLIEKIYIAICQGKPKNLESEVNLLIQDKKNHNKKFDSVTRYKIVQSNNKLSNIIFFPKTGRTHQIRIVAKHIGTPIIGDTKYNKNNKYKFEKLKLNAHILKFNFKNTEYKFISKLPDHFKDFYKKNNLKKISTNNLF